MYVPVNTSTFVYFMVYECELDMCSAETSCRSVAPSLKKIRMDELYDFFQTGSYKPAAKSMLYIPGSEG